MRALICEELGSPDVLRLREVPDPVAGADEVVIDVVAAGVNFPDGLMVAGRYQTRPELPFVPGSEVAGTISALGDSVVGLEIGQRVSAFCGIGGYAEKIAVSGDHLYPLPQGSDTEEAAAMPVAYGTSYHGLVDLGDLLAGETLLVLGAAGGVGLTAVEIGSVLGARVIAAASTDEKLALCRKYGADEVINYAEEDLGERLKELTGGAGVDVVYDPVGGAAAETAMRRLAWRGRFLTVGYASGDIPRVSLNRLLLNEGTVRGVLWGAWARRNPAASRQNMQQVLAWHEAGRLRPHLGGVWQLEEGAIALKTVMGRGAHGKVVLRCGQETR